MAPTETSILTNFLLSPAPLTSILSLQQFTDLFPRAHRSNPQVKLLYRELQHLRSLDMDDIRENILREVRQGEKQKQELWRAIRAARHVSLGEDDLREVELDTQMLGSTSTLPRTKSHSLSTIIRDMGRACDDLQSHVTSLDAEIGVLTKDLESIVDELSDLRYGKFSQTPGLKGLVNEVAEGLRTLEQTHREAPNAQNSI